MLPIRYRSRALPRTCRTCPFARFGGECYQKWHFRDVLGWKDGRDCKNVYVDGAHNPGAVRQIYNSLADSDKE